MPLFTTLSTYVFLDLSRYFPVDEDDFAYLVTIVSKDLRYDRCPSYLCPHGSVHTPHRKTLIYINECAGTQTLHIRKYTSFFRSFGTIIVLLWLIAASTVNFGVGTETKSSRLLVF